MTSVRPPPHGNLTNTNVGSINLYTGKVSYNAFEYDVNTAASAIFSVLFVLSLVIHIGQGIKSKYWFTIYTLGAAALTEAIGWIFRLWAAVALEWSPLIGGQWYYPPTAFKGQIVCLIIAPAFSTAANYIILGILVSRLGPQYCRIRPKIYTIIFIAGDILSLLIQAIGGGIASVAMTVAKANRGAHIMVVGVIVQMVVMILFCLVFAEFYIRYLRCSPIKKHLHPSGDGSLLVPAVSVPPQEEKKANLMLAALAGSTLLIFIRSIFRTIELASGFFSSLATGQILFCVLDALMIALSSILLNVLHPMFLIRKDLPTNHQGRDYQAEKGKDIGLVERR